MGSTAEAELGYEYINTREVLPIRVCLEEMGHPELILVVNNATAVDFFQQNNQTK